jgi:2'-5' RNA ligase
MIRAFIAIHLPVDVKARLAEAQRELQKLAPASAVRWTPMEQMHLTLRFLGDVSEDVLGPLTDGLRRAADRSEPFALRARGAGCFPNARRPRVIWVGVTGPGDALLCLQRCVVEATASWGERDDREFHAHLTLGRIKEGNLREAARLGEAVTGWAEREFGACRVSSVALMRSELSPQGAKHSVLAEAALGAPVSPE